MTSYQKLKEKNAHLMQDIYAMIRKADTVEGVVIKSKYQLMFAMEDQVMAGSKTTEEPAQFDGLIKLIES